MEIPVQHVFTMLHSIKSQLKTWTPVVALAAVNCHDHRMLCLDHNIQYFPTLKYFKYSSKDKNDGKIFGGTTAEKFPLRLASLVYEDWLEQKPKNWPNFNATASDLSLDDIWKNFNDSVLLVALIVEPDPQRITWAEMINFASNERVQILQASVDNAAIKDLNSSKSDQSKQLYMFERGSPNPVVESRERITFQKVREQIIDELRRLRPQEFIEEDASSTSETATVKVTWTQFEVHIVDLLSTLYNMLKTEIPNDLVFKRSKLKGLKIWMKFLAKYMPSIHSSAGKLCKSLYGWLTTQHKEVQRTVWLDRVNKYMRETGHPIKFASEWMACRGSKPFLRDYNCGLWTLFHVLTVAAHTRRNQSDINAVEEVLKPIHQFIMNFLNCEHCKNHFDAHYLKTVGANQTYYSETVVDIIASFYLLISVEKAIMWLWDTHNIVNKVLAQLGKQDPAFPKQQFPPRSLCSSCWNDDHFDKPEVLNFLVNYYGKQNITYTFETKKSGLLDLLDLSDSSRASTTANRLGWTPIKLEEFSKFSDNFRTKVFNPLAVAPLGTSSSMAEESASARHYFHSSNSLRHLANQSFRAFK
ncbi:unnamed protein product [Enterobius vermicularis]|uniref:Sulfhydryl oxidase n=1 Tax=Enterobius vermicularis TaxID=51028 RepID=A0A0N4VKM0_ENTVE|nr:unnamed protein product [Enterobius vermicularis]